MRTAKGSHRDPLAPTSSTNSLKDTGRSHPPIPKTRSKPVTPKTLKPQKGGVRKKVGSQATTRITGLLLKIL